MSARVRRAADAALIGLFLVGIAAPLTAQTAGARAVAPARENRALAPLPAIRPTLESLQAFPTAFGRWYDDHFGLREVLVREHNRVKAAIGVSGVPRVVLGRNGWLFVDEGRDMIDQYRGLRPLDGLALVRWRECLAARRAWLDARGIAYVLAVVPEKHTVYPEYLPAYVTRVRPVTPLDQWLGYLARREGTIVDLRAVLVPAKDGPLLYDRTDTHWSSVGAFIAYRTILTALAERYGLPLVPRDLDAFRLVAQAGPGGDLARMLGLEDVYREVRQVLVPREPLRARRVEVTTRRGRTVRVYESGDPRALRAVVLHDSFGLALIPYLSEHFARTVYVHERDMIPELIEMERPDVVIHEVAERVLVVPPRDDEAIPTAGRRGG